MTSTRRRGGRQPTAGRRPLRPVGRSLATTSSLAAVALIGGCGLGVPEGPPSTDTRIGVTLVTSDSTDPYLVAVREGAERNADDYGVRLTVASGTGVADADAQVRGVDAAVARGDRGIVITPVPGVEDALSRARLAGLYVIALDTTPDPADAADITFASDPREAGRLLGAWVAGRLDGEPARVAMLGLGEPAPGAVDHDQGFLAGLGAAVADPEAIGDEPTEGVYAPGATYALVCRESGDGTTQGGSRAMEACLAEAGPVGVVYAADEPTALGVLSALGDAGPDRPVVVTVDADCAGVAAVRDGRLGAVVQRDPAGTADLAVGSIAKIARGGVKPSTTARLGVHDTGVELVTDLTVVGVPSTETARATLTCWG